MFRNYLLIAVRTIFRNKVFSAINVAGLAIGISASLIIYLMVRHDFSFDNFHKDEDRIFRIVSQFKFSGESFYNSGVAMPLAPAVKKEIPGIEYTAPLYTMNSDVRVIADTAKNAMHKNQSNIVFAGADYFRLFEYRWIIGSPSSAFNDPYQVVLTEKRAQQYFPGLSPSEVVGKFLTINDSIRCKITGIVNDLPSNTDLTFSMFVSWPTLELKNMQPEEYGQWTSTNSASQLFVKLRENEKPQQVMQKLETIYKKYSPPPADRKPAVNPFLLQPIRDFHFDGRFGTYYDNRLANKATLYSLLTVAVFILILGCINYVNLSTAQASRRAKEIGIRKTMGSSKKQLIVQFLTETLLLTFTATLLSGLLTPVLLQLLEQLVPAGIIFNPFSEPAVLIFLVCLILVVTVLAGFYPALVLSGYKPVDTLKDKFYVQTKASAGLSLRRTLTVSQFVIAQFFIMAVIMVSMQLRYTLTKDPGFKKDAIIHFQVSYYEKDQSKKYVLLEKIKKIPGISMISLSNNPVAANGTWSSAIKFKNDGKESEVNVQLKMGDSNYIKLYGLKMLAGRPVRQSDSIREFVINDSYAKVLGFNSPADAIGKNLEMDNKLIPIVGVVADFHQQSFHAPIKPLAISCWPENQRTFNIGFAGSDGWEAIITRIQKAFGEVYPASDFEYSFQDEIIKQYYSNEKRTAFLLQCAMVITIIISCLGLLGLTIYSTTRRTKEIGIRKVLGATVMQIVQLITREFFVLITLAFVISAPLAYWAITVWLQDFAYKVNMSWWIFPLTLLAQVVIAMITICSQAIRTALVNPARILKTE